MANAARPRDRAFTCSKYQSRRVCMKAVGSALAALGLVSVLAACGGGSAATGPAPSPTPVTPCLSVVPPQLVYPAPNATGAPTTFDLYVSYQENPSGAFGPPVLTPGSVSGSPWSAPSPGPTPPGSANPTEGPDWVSHIQNLSHATTYTVKVTNGQCQETFTLGSFTTL